MVHKYEHDHDSMLDLSLYIHWPFCESKCPYCDFNSHVRDRIDMDEWRDAYILELKKMEWFLRKSNIRSIFFGGGTPSLMKPYIIQDILLTIRNICNLDLEKIEITLEANPSSVELALMKDFRSAGINRVSLGIQSLRDDSLRFLGRAHSAYEAVTALSQIRNIFDRYSFDLIYALPFHTTEIWEMELNEALDMAGDHISLYTLTIEDGTKFGSLYNAGLFNPIHEDIAADIYVRTNEILARNGFEHYEISNYARNKKYGLHNMNYWRYGYYLGIGPGAHSRLPIARLYIDDNLLEYNRKSFKRWAIDAIKSPETWIQGVVNGDDSIIYRVDELSAQEQAHEKILLGLRTREGLILDENLMHFVDREFLGRALSDGYLDIYKDINENIDINSNLYVNIGNDKYPCDILGGERVYATEKGMIVLDYILRGLVKFETCGLQ